MITAKTPGQPVEYVLTRDRNSEVKTIFLFKDLTFKEEEFIKDIAIKVSNAGKYKDKKMQESQNVCLHIALAGAKNFFREGEKEEVEWKRDEKKKAVFGETKPWTDGTLLQIQMLDRIELYGFVVSGYTDLEDKDLKNS